MGRRGRQLTIDGISLNSKCWTCYNSDKSGCSWAKDFTHINGWVIHEDKRKVYNHKTKTLEYKPNITVIECPEYIDERSKNNDISD